MKVMPDSIRPWLPRPILSLGTNGYGRSDSRRDLRDFFEVDWRYVSLGTLASLMKEDKLKLDTVKGAMEELEIDPEKLNPLVA